MVTRKAALGAGALLLGASLVAFDPAVAKEDQGKDKNAVAQPGCKLANGIKHVVHITFDNVHFTRDNPNVPSDLEQMPNLLNFLVDNGAFGTNHHTPLISHTANDILTALSGVYPNRLGMPVSNSYRVFAADGSIPSHSSFVYWTATDATDGKPALVNENGKNSPAPWVPFTRIGCDVGAYSVADMEFETLPSDAVNVFGAGSADAIAAAKTGKGQTGDADYLGIAVHCAKNSPRCANAAPDSLPDEPGGYVGFTALYGNIHVQPAISPTGPIRDLDGVVIGDTTNANGFSNAPGFPNFFNPTATQSLGYLATMLEAGVQVVYGYIADAHDNRHGSNPNTFGPGEAAYVSQLHEYDVAWGKFFSRLAADGIDKSNTLFIVTADEGDHFVGGAPSPVGCDGVHVPCTYVDPVTKARSVGELTANLDSLLLTQRGSKTQFLVHADDAANLYIAGNPGPTDPVTRKLEQDVGALTFINPLFGKNNQTDVLAPFLADRAMMNFLHMVTSSPARTPSFTMFGDPDYFFQTTTGSLPLAPKDCSATPTLCVFQSNGFAWNHGDVQAEIVTTFLGIVGPGVRNLGIDKTLWSDHTDVRPTMVALLGLTDDYVHDGRVLVEHFDDKGKRRIDDEDSYVRLAVAYKQITAPVGELAMKTLDKATMGMNSNDPADAGYNNWLKFIAGLTLQRDALAAQIKTVLDAAAFGGGEFDDELAEQLARKAEAMLGHRVASASR
jgi:hypothetical protein